MNDDFHKILGLSLMADYFNVSYLRDNGRGYDLNFLCKKTISADFANVFLGLNSKYSCWECDEDDRYCWFEFNSEDDREKVEDYFMRLNHSNRKSSMIAMPDLYEGTANVKAEICDYYLAAIEGVFESDFKTSIAIPFGICEDDASIRMFMLYDEQRMIGLYKGTDVFKNSPVKFVN